MIEVLSGLVFAGLVFVYIVVAVRRVFTRRGRAALGPAAMGSVYELLNKERQKAIEIVVEGRAEESDPEDADGNLPALGDFQPSKVTERGRIDRLKSSRAKFDRE